MKSNFFEKLIINKDEKTKQKMRNMNTLLDDSYQNIFQKRKEKNNEKIIDNEKKPEIIKKINPIFNQIVGTNLISFEILGLPMVFIFVNNDINDGIHNQQNINRESVN